MPKKIYSNCDITLSNKITNNIVVKRSKSISDIVNIQLNLNKISKYIKKKNRIYNEDDINIKNTNDI